MEKPAALGSRQLDLSLSLALALLLAFSVAPTARGLTFTLEKTECFLETVPGGQSIMVGFVVSKYQGSFSQGDGPHEIDVKVRSGSERPLKPHSSHILSLHRSEPDHLLQLI